MGNRITATITRAFPRVDDAWMNSPGNDGRKNRCTFLVLGERNFPDTALRIQAAAGTVLPIMALAFDRAHRDRDPVGVCANPGRKRAARAHPCCLR